MHLVVVLLFFFLLKAALIDVFVQNGFVKLFFPCCVWKSSVRMVRVKKEHFKHNLPLKNKQVNATLLNSLHFAASALLVLV